MKVAIDWDGTLMGGKEWLPGAQNAMKRLREEGHKVYIHSCNNPFWIERHLAEAGLVVDGVWRDPGKPIADLYVDDRAYQFGGNWSYDLKDILERLRKAT